MRFPVFFAAFVFSLPTLLTAAAPATPPDGAALYQLNCAVCHNAAGEGIAGIFPPLAKADYLMADKERSIRIVIQGLSGPIKVNGIEYQGVMPTPPPLEDRQIADILTKALTGELYYKFCAYLVAVCASELASRSHHA